MTRHSDIMIPCSNIEQRIGMNLECFTVNRKETVHQKKERKDVYGYSS